MSTLRTAGSWVRAHPLQTVVGLVIYGTVAVALVPFELPEWVAWVVLGTWSIGALVAIVVTIATVLAGPFLGRR